MPWNLRVQRQAACHRAWRPCQAGTDSGTPDPPAISSPLWGVSDVALRPLSFVVDAGYLKWCLRRTGSDVTHVTCVYPLVAALLSSELRPEPHVSEMPQTQNPYDRGRLGP
jgi:hypothetical protein